MKTSRIIPVLSLVGSLCLLGSTAFAGDKPSAIKSDHSISPQQAPSIESIYKSLTAGEKTYTVHFETTPGSVVLSYSDKHDTLQFISRIPADTIAKINTSEVKTAKLKLENGNIIVSMHGADGKTLVTYTDDYKGFAFLSSHHDTDGIVDAKPASAGPKS